ncbi:MAG TPA: acetate kinase [Sediminispirochaeta sp.]|nr:acetate kinase [Sediminispirochaeta sp.]
MDILTLNCGSSSVKYQVYDWDNKEILANGIVERIGQQASVIEHHALNKETLKKEAQCPSHKEAIKLIVDTLMDPEVGAIEDMSSIMAVGHRVVQGGDKFSKSVIIDDEALNTFKEVSNLAPLHNPANIQGIEAAKKILPDVPHCAVMDTAWHQTMPKHAFLYALPYSWYENYGVRKYGFHGTSFLYVAKRTAALLGKDPHQLNAIICHIGNGASICAVKDGVSVDTSMGLTPLEGLIMGTRSGDFDPAVVFHMMKSSNLSPEEIETQLNKKSGILGITEKYIDRRDVETAAQSGDQRSQLAIDMEAYRLKKYIGAYAAALGRVDALVFTAGVGEMAPLIREKVLEGLENLGIKMDREKNKISKTRNAETDIGAADSPTKIFVVPTDEELVMTEDTYALVKGEYDVHTNFTYSFQDPHYSNKGRAKRLEKDIAKKPELADIVARPE